MNYRTVATSAFAVIESRDPVNTYALAEALAGLPGVKAAEPEVSIGASSDIKAWKHPEGVMFSYMKGAGDCASGCIYKKYWKFFVDKKNRVTFKGTHGSLPKDVPL